MRRTTVLAVALLRNWIRSRSGVFFSVLFPVMLLLIFATIFGGTGGDSKYYLYIQNMDTLEDGSETNLSVTFRTILNASDLFILETVPPDVDARRYVQDRIGTFGAFRLLVISQGFESHLLNASMRSRLHVTSNTTREFVEQAGEAIPPAQKIGIELGLQQLDAYAAGLEVGEFSVKYIRDPSNSASQIVEGILRNFVDTFNYMLIGVRSETSVTSEDVVENEYKAVDFYIPGLIGAFIMTNGIIGVTTNTTDFKRRGILKRFATTPLRRIEWILGNVIAQTALSFLLVGVMLAVGWIVFGVRALPNFMTCLLVVAGAFLFSGIALILSGVITDVEAASSAGNAIAFPMMFLSGSFIPLEIMPSFMQTVSKVLPLTYLSDGLRSALIFHHMPSTLSNLGIVGVLAVVFILIGSITTRWHEP